MENKEIKNEIKVTPAEIDPEVLEVMAKECAMTATKDDKQMNRVLLNCMCEMLSQFQQMNRAFDNFMQVLTICGAEKIEDYFTKLKTNVNNEIARQNVKKKIAQSHKKSQKGKKTAINDDKIVKFPSNDVK